MPGTGRKMTCIFQIGAVLLAYIVKDADYPMVERGHMRSAKGQKPKWPPNPCSRDNSKLGNGATSPPRVTLVLNKGMGSGVVTGSLQSLGPMCGQTDSPPCRLGDPKVGNTAISPLQSRGSPLPSHPLCSPERGNQWWVPNVGTVATLASPS